MSKIEAITIKPHAKLYIMGMGCIARGQVQRMLIPIDMEAMMGGIEMGLPNAARH